MDALVNKIWELSEDWIDKAAAARLLEEDKTAVLSRFISEEVCVNNNLSHAAAERIVKSSPQWGDYIQAMCEARKQSDLARAKLECLRLEFQVRMSNEATARKDI